VYFSVSGSTAPTPSPKPICSPLFGQPSKYGNAPLVVSLNTGQDQQADGSFLTIQSVYWDFDGNGSWDKTASDLSAQSYTYTIPGTYFPKVYLLATNGQSSDICQTSIVVY
jgi:PKD repeat protein